MQTNKNIGFAGAGNMASAIIGGIVKKKIVNAKNVFVFDVDQNKLNALEKSFKIQKASSISDLAAHCDILVMCIKPNIMETVLNELKPKIGDKSLVSIAAGWSAARIKSVLGHDKKVLRLMPNTPLMIGAGMTVFEVPSNVNTEDFELVKSIFNALGETAETSEKLMDAVTAVSGSGPAYVYMFIDALADGGVLQGLPKDIALKLAAQTVLGSAKMVQETGRHPYALKDAVCSPGGTTIEAVKALEESAFSGIVISAVEKCADKSRKLSK